MMTRSIKSRHKSRQAFTLVELLVVLAVLAGKQNSAEVLYVGYCATDKSMADFYYNGTWSHVYPKDAKPTAAIYNHNNKDRNYMMINGKEVQLQMIVVSNKSGKENDFWIWDAGKEVTLQGHSEKYFKG